MAAAADAITAPVPRLTRRMARGLVKRLRVRAAVIE